MEIVSDIASSILYLLCVYFVFNNRKVLENLHSGIDAIVRYKKDTNQIQYTTCISLTISIQCKIQLLIQ